MDRRLFRAPARWQDPGRLSLGHTRAQNIAWLCCDSWAAGTPTVAVIHRGADGTRQVWTYGQIKRASDGLAVALAAQGVGRGDRVAVLLAQHPFVLVAHMAVLKLGAVVLPLFTFGEDALRYRLAEVARGRWSPTPTTLTRAGAAPRCAGPFHRGLYRRGPCTGAALPELIRAGAGLYPGRYGRRRSGHHDLYLGHDGRPQGRAACPPVPFGSSALHGTEPSLFPRPFDIGWTPADWAWIGGLMDMAMPCLYYGVPLVSHRFAKFDPDAAYWLMAEEGVSNAFIPPTALRLMKQVAVPGPAPAGGQFRGRAARGGHARLGQGGAWCRDQRALRPDRGQPDRRRRLGFHGLDGAAGAGA